MTTSKIGKVFPCNYCDKIFLSQSQRSGHMKAHARMRKTVVCDVPSCGKVFKDDYWQRHHTLTQHSADVEPSKEDGLFHCPLCRKRYKNLNSRSHHVLKSHFRDRLKSRDFHCHLCKDSFTNENALKFHFNWHATYDSKADDSKQSDALNPAKIDENITIEEDLPSILPFDRSVYSEQINEALAPQNLKELNKLILAFAHPNKTISQDICGVGSQGTLAANNASAFFSVWNEYNMLNHTFETPFHVLRSPGASITEQSLILAEENYLNRILAGASTLGAAHHQLIGVNCLESYVNDVKTLEDFGTPQHLNVPNQMLSANIPLLQSNSFFSNNQMLQF
ncbi:zinc finger protein 76 [Ditylenchus destructor]|nr:zinc finger protein 76 [Ditylenchus destructor]